MSMRPPSLMMLLGLLCLAGCGEVNCRCADGTTVIAQGYDLTCDGVCQSHKGVADGGR